MIVVDTNVISEVMRPQPSPAVLDWLNTQDSNLLFITTVTLAEIRYGLRVLPVGLRRQQLKTRFEQFIAQAFE
ncbi:MAG: PIN domain-containing protein, partial [Thiobacillus sp.]